MENVCDGTRFEMHGSRIAVEHEGYPEVKPNDPRYQYLLNNIENWGPHFRAASAKHGVPASWLVGVATIETGLWSHDPKRQASIVSPAGAVGIMQIMPQYQPETRAELQEPATNIDVGARILRQRLDEAGGKLPYAVAAYNSGTSPVYKGGCRVGRNEWNFRADHNYPRQVIEYAHAAQALGVDGPSPVIMAAWGAVAGAAVAMFLLTLRG